MQWIHSQLQIKIETGEILSSVGYWYREEVALMKASQEQKDAATSSQNFTNTLRSQFQTQFANTSGIQNTLATKLSGIMDNAANGQGYTPATLAALNSNNTEANAIQSNNAVQALNRQVQQQSNGGAVPTGASNQLRAQILSNGAASTATGQRNILTQNANLANSNLFNASNQLSSLTGQMSSTGSNLLSGAVSNGANSYNEVTQAYQPSNLVGNLLSGALAAGGTALAGPLGGAIGSKIGGAISGSSSSGGSTYDYDTMGA